MTDSQTSVRLNASPEYRRPASAMIRVEKRPANRFVTVVSGLQTYGPVKLREIAGQIKVAHGGVVDVKGGRIEVYGDKLNQVKAWFASKTV